MNPTLTPCVCLQYVEKARAIHQELLLLQWQVTHSATRKKALLSSIGLLTVLAHELETINNALEDLHYIATTPTAQADSAEDIYQQLAACLAENAPYFELSPELKGFVESLPSRERERGEAEAQNIATEPKYQRKTAKAQQRVQAVIDGIVPAYEDAARQALTGLAVGDSVTRIRQYVEQRSNLAAIADLTSKYTESLVCVYDAANMWLD